MGRGLKSDLCHKNADLSMTLLSYFCSFRLYPMASDLT